MATTRYVVAATPSSPEAKVISNLKSARVEADARAKLDRVDVTVTTEATNKLSYTAQGAPVAVTAEPAPVEAPVETPVEPFPEVAPEDEVEAEFAKMIAEDPEFAAMIAAPDGDAPVDAEAPAEAELAEDAATPDPDEAAEAPDIADLFAQLKAELGVSPVAEDPDRKAPCGCPVEKILKNGEHGKGCADAPARREAASAVKKDPQPRQAAARRSGATGRRASLGASEVPEWELLYDKPAQKAQVGRNAQGYALICTTHKTAHKLARLVQERALRQGPRSAWCPECTG